MNGKDLLKKNIKEQKQKDSFSCPYCRDTGYIIIPQLHSQPLMKPCKCKTIEKTSKHWRNSGININDLDKDFRSFEVWNSKSREIKEKSTNYFLRFNEIKGTRRNSILLSGNPGAGKTHMALALANKLLEKGVQVIYMPYRSVITELKQNMLDKEYYQKTLSRYQTCEVLLIDDLFKGKITESDINIVFEIVNHRYLNHLPMIISTEFIPERMLAFDEAIGSRIYEMSKDFIIQVIGQENNYRLR